MYVLLLEEPHTSMVSTCSNFILYSKVQNLESHLINAYVYMTKLVLEVGTNHVKISSYLPRLRRRQYNTK